LDWLLAAHEPRYRWVKGDGLIREHDRVVLTVAFSDHGLEPGLLEAISGVPGNPPQVVAQYTSICPLWSFVI
jgi:hypothetical protein